MTALLLILVPLIGALASALVPARMSRWVALVASLALLGHSVVAAIFFGAWGTPAFALELSIPWLETFGVSLSLGADSVSMTLILLNALLTPLCVWGSFSAISMREREYYAWMLGLAAAVNGVFLARDLVFFYICFEFTLVPLFFLIAIYGGDNRERASIKFFLYTFTGSLITLAGLLYVAWQFSLWRASGAVASATTWTFDIATLTQFASTELLPGQQAFVLFALMAGFAVKVPLFPVHTWLPLAHTEAPTAGSVLLAGVLLKLGTYGLYRFALPMVPDAVVTYAPAIAILSIIGILYAALICWVQDDVKRLIAYSSVSHLGFCVLGLFALNPLGAQGAVLYMINHGLSTGALFLCVGMIYERFHTRDMDAMSGLARRMPVWGFFMVFFTMSSLGLPGLNGFVSEFLCLIGAFVATPDAETGYLGRLGPWYAVPAGIGMIFAAMYLLIMVGKVVFGPLRVPHEGAHGQHGGRGTHAGAAGRAVHAGQTDAAGLVAHEAVPAGLEGHGPPALAGRADHGALAHGADSRSHLPVDLSGREVCVLIPLALLCVVLGLQPRILTDAIAGSIRATLADYAVPSGLAAAPAAGDVEANGPATPETAEIKPAAQDAAADSGDDHA